MTILWIFIAFVLGYMTASAMFLIAHIKDAKNGFVFDGFKKVSPDKVDIEAMAEREYLDLASKQNNPLT